MATTNTANCKPFPEECNNLSEIPRLEPFVLPASIEVPNWGGGGSILRRVSGPCSFTHIY